MSRTLKAISLSLVILVGFVSVQATSEKKAPRPNAKEIKKMKAAMPVKATVKPKKPRTILVINLCKGFRHSCIHYWDEALTIMGKKTGAFTTVISSDLNMLRPEKIRMFDAVLFNNTTKLGINPKDTPEICKGLMDFLKNGKGVVGIHAATDNFDKWPEMAHIMGGIFTGHPWGSGGTWAFKIDDPTHPLMKAFKGKGFKEKDEIYRTAPPHYSRSKQRVLMSLDMSDPATKGKASKPTDADTGISWIKEVGKGRVFYGSLGHNHHITWNATILQHYLDGIQWAIGDLKADATPKPAPKAVK